MKKNFFTKRKIITFYSKMEKHKIFKKIKIFYRTLSFRKNKDFLPNIILKDKYCENFKNTYFEELLRTAASEIVFIKHYSKLIVSFIKMKRSGISQKLRKLCRKKKIVIRSSKYDQPLYNFLKNISSPFSPYCFLSKTHQEIEFL